MMEQRDEAGTLPGTGGAPPAGEEGPVVGPGIEELDAAATVARAVALRRSADAAEAQLLAVAAHYADLHAVSPGQPAAGQPAAGEPGGISVGGAERLVPLAGPGTPEVAEFAPAELGAALGMSSYAAGRLIGHTLELRHRLPRCWARVHAGTLPAWRARQIAEATTGLPAPAAAWVDAQVAAFAHKIGSRRLGRLIQAALIRFDPAAARNSEQQARAGRGVWVGEEMTQGTRSIRIEADALDATSFEQTITALAAALAALGDPDQVDLRRAKAVGVLADPQAALDLLTAGPGSAKGGERSGPAGAAGRGGPRVTLYLHLHHSALQTGTGVGRVEGLGPATVAQIKDWVGHAQVTLTPVLDLADRAAVDAYEVPDRIAETVLLRTPCCPFPWCNNLSRSKDTDHITPYAPDGPSGQTGPDNLAALCRRHHRLKTHAGWSYTMPEPGIYLWRSPHGRRYLVDHTGTTALTTAA
jgi:hypothetical protein